MLNEFDQNEIDIEYSFKEKQYQYYCPSCGYKREGLLDHPAIGIGSYSTLCPECGEHYNSYETN